jgi:RNA polymerase sigma-70 factor (ECF subfamily)
MQLYAPVHNRFERFCRARAYGEFHYRDLMQDTVLVVLEKLHQLKSDDAFLYFLFGTAQRILQNQRRKRRPQYLETYSDAPEGQHQPPHVEQQLEIRELYAQLSKLDAVTRECLILFEISGFSVKEIMTLQNMGESAVKQRLSRGRKQLMALMYEPERKTA